jgi:NADH-quinone oxidoreductase subunit H
MSETTRALLNVFGVLIAVLSLAGLMVWGERRLLAVFQERYGPNRVGPFGLLQTVADTIKLIWKEDWVPPFADRFLFVLAPALIVVTGLLSFLVIPIAPGIGVADVSVGILFFLALSSMGAYSVVLAGWSSNSKYSLLGGVRSAAQMVSYEVFMGLALMGVVLLAGSFDLRVIVEAQRGLWFCIPQALGMTVFFIAGLAEAHRLPYDLPEAESELIAGYHSEYSGMKFAMFMVGEYVGVALLSSLVVTLYFGGWLGPFLPPVVWFVLKVLAVVFLFILIRGALPRPRYDQLMATGWKVMMPLALLNLVVTGFVVVASSDAGDAGAELVPARSGEQAACSPTAASSRCADGVATVSEAAGWP